MPTYEIEKKYLVTHIPFSLEPYPYHVIEQGYLCTNPVVRIRKQGHAYYLTYKGSGLLKRVEYNLDLTKQAYEHLKEKVDGIVITKKRYLIPLTGSNYTIELDLFEGHYQSLTLAEVEFPTEGEALTFQPPEWFSKDVTMDTTYYNSTMSMATSTNVPLATPNNFI
ncbi:MAG: CYTH domain-containing protein [Eubacteriales bacterium]